MIHHLKFILISTNRLRKKNNRCFVINLKFVIDNILPKGYVLLFEEAPLATTYRLLVPYKYLLCIAVLFSENGLWLKGFNFQLRDSVRAVQKDGTYDLQVINCISECCKFFKFSCLLQ